MLKPGVLLSLSSEEFSELGESVASHLRVSEKVLLQGVYESSDQPIKQRFILRILGLLEKGWCPLLRRGPLGPICPTLQTADLRFGAEPRLRL